jgi:hypothetical protein
VTLRASQSNQTNDIRARFARMELARVHRQLWSNLVQYGGGGAFLDDGSFKSTDIKAMHADYFIFPNGSADGWNKEAQLKRAMDRKQMFTGDPNINQI